MFFPAWQVETKTKSESRLYARGQNDYSNWYFMFSIFKKLLQIESSALVMWVSPLRFWNLQGKLLQSGNKITFFLPTFEKKRYIKLSCKYFQELMYSMSGLGSQLYLCIFNHSLRLWSLWLVDEVLLGNQ